jgi:hypothetical protein
VTILVVKNDELLSTFGPFHDTDYETSTADHPESAPHENELKARGEPPKDGFTHGQLYTNHQPRQPAEEHNLPLRFSAVLYTALLDESRHKCHKE